MKTKVLFIMPSMHIGGSAVSLLNLLELLKDEEITTSLFLMDHNGNLQSQITDSVQLCPEDKRLAACLCSKDILLRKYGIKGLLTRLQYIIKQKINGRKRAIETEYRIAAEKLSNKYDVIIAFQEDMATRFGQFIKAKNKIAWVHNDYEKIYGAIDNIQIKEMYDAYSHIVCVSKAARQSFVDAGIKSFENIEVIYNTMDVLKIRSRAIEYDVNFDTEGYRIVSVGRFAPQKAFERIPTIAKVLKEKNITFKWIVVGDGDSKEAVALELKNNGVDDVVELIGAKMNPYPYIIGADLLVITSLYEAHPMVANEALILHTPVISTRFSSVTEAIKDGENGVITDNSGEALAEKILCVLTELGRIDKLKNNVTCFEYDNNQIIEKIKQMIKK